MILNDILLWYAAIVATLVLIADGWALIRQWFQKKVAAAAEALSSSS